MSGVEIHLSKQTEDLFLTEMADVVAECLRYRRLFCAVVAQRDRLSNQSVIEL